MSITNKLVANIKQTDVDISKFTDTNNVICIDTSNNRIGINTKTPRYSIDICGINNKIFVSNLEVAQNASFFSISGTTINCLDGSFARNLDTSFINFKTISGSLIRATTILGISGAIVDLSGTNIKLSNELRAVTISANTINAGTVNTDVYNIETGSFSNINVTKNNTTTTITGGTIVAVSIVANTIDCSTLTANFMQSNRINCAQTLSAGTVRTNNLMSASGQLFFKPSGELYVLATGLGDQNIANIQTLISGEIARQSTRVQTDLIEARLGLIDDCCINTLRVTNININGHLILPQQTSGMSYNGVYRSLAIKKFGIGNNLINSLTLYNSNSKWSNIFTATHYATLDLSSSSATNIASYIIKSDNTTVLPNYRYIPIKFKTINNSAAKTQLFSINSSNKYIEISNTDLSSGIYEINASVTLSFNNIIRGDVEPNDFTFGLYDNIILDSTDANINTIIETSYNYVKNKNLILAFDTSYNYSSVSLNYIGPLYNNYNYSVNNTRGLCYLVNSQKDISNFNVEYFSSTIKLLNYDT